MNRYYDFYTGRVRKEVDPNGLATEFSFADPLNRLKTITRGVGAGSSIQDTSTITYSDTPQTSLPATSVQTLRGQYSASDNRLNAQVGYDPLGRQILTQVNGSETILTSTIYDGYGQIYQQCNPQKSGVAGPTDGCTTFNYDAVGRVLSAQTADGAQTATSYTVQTNAPRMTVQTVTDAAGKQRVMYTDAIGRLTSVTAVRNPAYVTSYSYDFLDNLTDVDIPNQNRHFTYDSARRLRSATNPESGTTTYSYDASGNLVKRTDARGVITCYGNLSGANCDNSGYDSLNRPVKVTYNEGTPMSVFCYDGASYSGGSCAAPGAGQKMRRTGVGNQTSATNYSFDLAGRMISSTQTTFGGANPFVFTYSYYPDDSLASTSMPQGNTYTNCYDANQRMTWVSRVRTAADCMGGGGSGALMASAQSFTPAGAPTSVLFGNGLTEVTAFNNRLQMTSRTAGISNANRLALLFFYCAGQQTACNDNNGNLQSQSIGYAAGAGEGAFSTSQQYGSDESNRLTGITEGSAYQNYQYDQPGNRWVPSYGGGLPALSPLTPTVQSAYESATNRLALVHHDNAGNQLKYNPFTLVYDAENRITSAESSNNGHGYYGYDADGRRVTKDANGITSVLVYDGFGQLAQEYGGEPVAVSGTEYLTTDHLGSTRLTTNSAGDVVKRYDYLPFGEALPAGLNGRSGLYSVGSYPAAGDGHSVKFTGKERDAESGLDYFGARYFSSAQGRFTSPDEFVGGPYEVGGARPDKPGPLPYADITNPQSLNKYAYALNNPLRYVDPDGHEEIDPDQLLINTLTTTGAAAGFYLGAGAGGAGGGFVGAFAGGVGAIPGSAGGALAGGAAGSSLGAAIGYGIGKLVVYFAKAANERNGSQTAESDAPSTQGKDGRPLGSNGARTTSSTLLEGNGTSAPRVDVENPNPGNRPGSLHLQVEGNKYQYNVNSGKLELGGKAAPKSVQEYLKNPNIQKAIQKGLKYLGESQ